MPELNARELVQDVIEREHRLQGEVVERLLAPSEAALDLLDQSGATIRRQAEALEAAGDALRETAALMASQAELFEQTIGMLRAPADAARSVLGAERTPRSGTFSGTRRKGRKR